MGKGRFHFCIFFLFSSWKNGSSMPAFTGLFLLYFMTVTISNKGTYFVTGSFKGEVGHAGLLKIFFLFKFKKKRVFYYSTS